MWWWRRRGFLVGLVQWLRVFLRLGDCVCVCVCAHPGGGSCAIAISRISNWSTLL
jgi:hypothetical protein